MPAGAGVVDEDYRGPVGVVLFNHSDLDFAGQTPQVTCACASLTDTRNKAVLRISHLSFLVSNFDRHNLK